MAYSKSASGILVCCIFAILVLSNEMHAVKAFPYTSECQEACKQVEQRSAQGCLWRCMYRCMPVVGSYTRCHPTDLDAQTFGPPLPEADSATSTTRKIKV